MKFTALILVLLAFAAGCTHTTNPLETATTVAPAKTTTRNVAVVNNCIVPRGDRNGDVTDCLANPNIVWAKPAPQLTVEDIRRGPPVADFDLSANAEVYCAYRYHPRAETSPKFRCFRTTALNFRTGRPEYYNKKGDIVSEAVSVGAEGSENDGYLLNASGQRIVVGGKEQEGLELKIKYFNGGTQQGSHFEGAARISNPREAEGFTEVAASRIFWALGLPVDNMFNVAKVHCFGCEADPFNQRAYRQGGTASFTDAAVEIKYPGKTISKDWSIGTARRTYYARWSPQSQLDHEALLLGAQLISYHNALSKQNRMGCEQGQMDDTSRACALPVAMINDVGSTFGGSRGGFLAGNSRGNLGDYRQAGGRAFSDPNRCVLNYDVDRITSVSRAGLEAFKQRLAGFDRDKVKAIFTAAKFDRVQATNDPEGTLNAWTAELLSRIEQIRAANCQ